jgi:AraC-like DNA-binding protein
MTTRAATCPRLVLAAVEAAPLARDPRVARALAAIEDRLFAKWTVRTLGRVAGASRAAFVRRFVANVGAPPMAYIRERRLAVVARRLVDEDVGLARLAADVGYANEFALSRAFKRRFGVAPTVYRRMGGAVAVVRVAA